MMNRSPSTIRPAMGSNTRPITAWLVYAAVGLAVLTNAVFGALSLFAPLAFLPLVGVHGVQLSVGAHVFAAYAGARELAIALALVVLVAMRRASGIASVLLLLAFANAFDLVHALLTQGWFQAPGAFAGAAIYLAAAIWLFRRSAKSQTIS